VLATLKRAASELSSSQRKLFKIDDNVGIAISGLTADGTAATKALRGDCITHKFTFESQVDVGRLAARVADKSQVSLFLLPHPSRTSA
jgi:20S proteasome subunit alpha 6